MRRGLGFRIKLGFEHGSGSERRGVGVRVGKRGGRKTDDEGKRNGTADENHECRANGNV